MHPVHLRAIDLNLLPVLDALLAHRSVTAAAEAVNLSQPATSRALGRLRALLGDPLLVRGPQGLVPTERAVALRPALAELLTGIGALVTESPLDPAVEERVFHVAMSDAHAVLLMPPLVARLAREAPGVSVSVVPYGPDIARRMTNGDMDAVLALTTTPLPPGAVSRPLARDELAVVTRVGHPTAGQAWQIGDYGRWPSVGIALVGDGMSDMDTLLARHGVTRTFVSTVPNFVTAMSIVGATDAVTTVSRAAAVRFRDVFDLAIRDAPFAETELAMTLVTAATRRSDRLLAWLCGVMVEEAERAFGTAALSM